MPFTWTTESTSRANAAPCTPTVGTPYSVSSVITWPETSGAHMLQRPTPRIAASPSCLMRSQSSGIRFVLVSPPHDLGPELRLVLAEPALHLVHEDVAVFPADVDEINGLLARPSS